MKLLKSLGFTLVLCSIALVLSFAPSAPYSDNLQPFIKLKFEQSLGTNASAVAYNPEKRLYYITFAGNASYPLEVVNESGYNVFKTTTKVDMRGLWYNSKTKRLEGNVAGSAGLFYINLDASGYPSGYPVYMCDSIDMPSFQAVGVSSGKELYFFDGSEINVLKASGSFAPKKSILLTGAVRADQYNSTSMAYTGAKGEEFAFFDHGAKRINFYDKKGRFIKGITVPGLASSPRAFCFSYANNAFFLFDIASRTWTGYR